MPLERLFDLLSNRCFLAQRTIEAPIKAHESNPATVDKMITIFIILVNKYLTKTSLT